MVLSGEKAACDFHHVKVDSKHISGIVIKKAPLYKKAPLVCPEKKQGRGAFLLIRQICKGVTLWKNQDFDPQIDLIRKPPLVCPGFETRGAFLITIPLIDNFVST